MGDRNGAFHDPDGPVVVGRDVPLDPVRGALGANRWLERPGGHSGVALFVGRDADAADALALLGVPAVVIVDTADEVVQGQPAQRVHAPALGEWLKAFDDGVLVSSREAEALSWVDAIRTEEERVQREGDRKAAAQLEEMAGHVAAIEASRSYRLARRLVAARERAARLVRRG